MLPHQMQLLEKGFQNPCSHAISVSAAGLHCTSHHITSQHITSHHFTYLHLSSELVKYLQQAVNPVLAHIDQGFETPVCIVLRHLLPRLSSSLLLPTLLGLLCTTTCIAGMLQLAAAVTLLMCGLVAILTL